MTQHEQLESWLAQEQQTQARLDAGVGPGVAKPQQLAGRSGLEMMRAGNPGLSICPLAAYIGGGSS